MGCASYQIDPYQEKIAKEGDDYIIERYKTKAASVLTFKVVIPYKDEEVIPYAFHIRINGLRFTYKKTEMVSFYVSNNQKYDIMINTLNYKTLRNIRIKPQYNDSLVIKAYMKEGITVF
ncbi:hypothetical protein RCZ04_22310 [Capnocytophaga sp. HP1101]